MPETMSIERRKILKALGATSQPPELAAAFPLGEGGELLGAVDGDG